MGENAVCGYLGSVVGQRLGSLETYLDQGRYPSSPLTWTTCG